MSAMPCVRTSVATPAIKANTITSRVRPSSVSTSRSANSKVGSNIARKSGSDITRALNVSVGMPSVAAAAKIAAPMSDMAKRALTNQKHPVAAMPMNSALASLKTMTFAGKAGNSHQSNASTAG